MNTRLVDVAAAVIERPDGAFLLAQRPEGKVYSGYWEFPGGKVESEETVMAALKRELHEELGLDVDLCYPWITRVHEYPHGTVRLHFLRVARWRGTPQSREGQAFVWQKADAISVFPMLPANAPVLRSLSLPTVYAITHAWETGTVAALSQLDRALEAGLRLIQVREGGLDADSRRAFCAEVVRRAHAHGAMVMINSDQQLAKEVGADGVHLPARELMEAEFRPDLQWCAASCHNAAELARAAQLGVDFVVLGPVAQTPSHAGTPAMGWAQFHALAAQFPVPVFAIGGMHHEDMHKARTAGAHGLAMIRGAWARD
jgi:8-oxo-dGTP diphosphatase